MLGARTLGTLALAACGTAATATTGVTSSGTGDDLRNAAYGRTRFSGTAVAQEVDFTVIAGALKWDKGQHATTVGDVTFVVKDPGPMRYQFGIQGEGDDERT